MDILFQLRTLPIRAEIVKVLKNYPKISKFKLNGEYPSGWNAKHTSNDNTQESIISISICKDTKYPTSSDEDIHGNTYPRFNNRKEEVMYLFYHELAHHNQLLKGCDMGWGEIAITEYGKKKENDANKYASRMYKRRR